MQCNAMQVRVFLFTFFSIIFLSFSLSNVMIVVCCEL